MRSLLAYLTLLLTASAASAQVYTDTIDQIREEQAYPLRDASYLRPTFNPDVAVFDAVNNVADLRDPKAIKNALLIDAKSKLRKVYELYSEALDEGDATALQKLQDIADTPNDWLTQYVARQQLSYLHLLSGDSERAYQNAQLTLSAVPSDDTSLVAMKMRYHAWSLINALHSSNLDAEMSLLATERMAEYAAKAQLLPPPSEIFYNTVIVLARLKLGEDAKQLLGIYADYVEGGQAKEVALFYHAKGRAHSYLNEHSLAVDSFERSLALSEDTFTKATIRAQIANELAKSGDYASAKMLLADAEIADKSPVYASAKHLIAASEHDYANAYDALRRWSEAQITSLEGKLSTAARTAREAMSVNAEVVDARLAEQASVAESARLEKRLAEERARRNRIVALLASLLAAVSMFSAIYIYRLLKEEKRLRAQADVLSHQAQAASRAKQQFISMMSHEFRTPLNHIIPIVDAYMRHTVNDPKGYTLAKIIDNASHRILRMIDEINTIAGGVEMLRDNIEPFPATRFAETLESEKDKGYVLQKSLQLDFSYAPDLPTHFAADPDKIERILVALAENAMKFAGDAPVTVGMRFEPPESWGERGWLVLDVTDTGGGMPQDLIERIMQPFTQGDMGLTRAHDGLGLGMNLVSILTRSLGGRFSVDGNHYSGGKRGTQVVVRLPAYASNAEGTWEAKPESADARKVREAVEAQVNARLGLRPRKEAA